MFKSPYVHRALVMVLGGAAGWAVGMGAYGLAIPIVGGIIAEIVLYNVRGDRE